MSYKFKCPSCSFESVVEVISQSGDEVPPNFCFRCSKKLSDKDRIKRVFLDEKMEFDGEGSHVALFQEIGDAKLKDVLKWVIDNFKK